MSRSHGNMLKKKRENALTSRNNETSLKWFEKHEQEDEENTLKQELISTRQLSVIVFRNQPILDNMQVFKYDCILLSCFCHELIV